MRISDWSSDVCSSDLLVGPDQRPVPPPRVRRPVDAGGDAGGRVIHDVRLNAVEHLRRLRTVLPQDVVEGPRRPLVHILQLVLEAIGDSGHLATGVFDRSEEHTSELQSLMRISYAVFCLQKKISNV